MGGGGGGGGGNPPVTGGFPSQRASYTEHVSMTWRRHGKYIPPRILWPWLEPELFEKAIDMDEQANALFSQFCLRQRSRILTSRMPSEQEMV